MKLRTIIANKINNFKLNLMIKTVAITGADDSIDCRELLELSAKFPFVEWGILISKRSMGAGRFPSLDWINKLQKLKQQQPELNLSCHLCGQWVKDILVGKNDEIEELPLLMFDRIQINTHGIKHNWNDEAFKILSTYPHEIIFQYDNENNHFLLRAKQNDVKHSALFDLSHGAGICPNEWPELIKGVKCGYAGGLGDDNLAEQIPLIESKAGDTEIWIDMETKVRSNNDYQFDLLKVERCLEIASKII